MKVQSVLCELYAMQRREKQARGRVMQNGPSCKDEGRGESSQLSHASAASAAVPAGLAVRGASKVERASLGAIIADPPAIKVS